MGEHHKPAYRRKAWPAIFSAALLVSVIMSASCSVTPLRPLAKERQNSALRDIKKQGSKLYFLKVQVVPRTYDFTFKERATSSEHMEKMIVEPVEEERGKYDVMEILDGRFSIPIYKGLFEMRFQ